VIGEDHRPIEPIESFLAWLSHIERSPNTVRAYAMDLKTYWTFLRATQTAWDRVTLEQVGRFTAWLRQPAENVIVLANGRPRRGASTVNRMLTAVFGFYEFHARHGVQVAKVLVDQTRSGRGSYKPFLHGIARAKPRGRVGRLREPRRLPATLTLEQVTAVIHAQRRLRDRFLFALLFATGMRIGQALGLRHEDFVTQERRIEIVPRDDNANGARGKGGEGSIPVSGQLVRCYSDYMHAEYGDLDSDYVFVNLWGGQMRPALAADLPAPQRLPDLRQLLHHNRVSPCPSRPAHPDRGAHRPRRDRRAPTAGRDERARPSEPAPHHRRARRPGDDDGR